MREIILDTETTGLSPSHGHRIIEIGCVELQDGLPTGKTFQQYINPQRDIPLDAFHVHGLSQEFLAGFPTFQEISQDFLAFIQDSPLVIHNAKFDLSFINSELSLISCLPLNNPIIDTVHLAKQKFPGSPSSLDALCRRFQISLSQRSLHGALLDAHLLTQVYLELGKPTLLYFKDPDAQQVKRSKRHFYAPRSFTVSDEEKALYQAMKTRLKKSL